MTTTAIEQLRTRLETVPLFARCNSRDLGTVARRSEIREVTSGEKLIEEGTAGEELFVLLAGAADVIRNDTKVGVLDAGSHFGELALLDPAPRNADVVMTEDGTVSVLTRPNFLLALDAIPGLAPALLAFLAARLRAAEAGPPAEAF